MAIKMFLPAELIKKKRAGEEHSQQEIDFLIQSFTDGGLPDYQMSAWLMAVFFKGLNSAEMTYLTQAMLYSGRMLDFSDLKNSMSKIDKHSTGGVGDKTSLIIAPIVASCGIAVPMISGRGLGHTGGTLDKLESIPGFRTQLELNEFTDLIKTYGLAFAGQTAEICPADRKIYALRDVTGTVESIPLIVASIMSKKLAEGIDGLVMDVKVGSGAFMKTQEQAVQLARQLISVGRQSGKKMAAIISNMNQPLGRFVGNSLEVEEAIAILKQTSCRRQPLSALKDTEELSLILAAHMIFLSGVASSFEEGNNLARQALMSGAAFELFDKISYAQGGRLSELPVHQEQFSIRSSQSGYIAHVDCEKIGLAAIHLGSGRRLTSDVITPTAGLELHCKIGEKIEKGQILYTLYFEKRADLSLTQNLLMEATTISEKKPQPFELVIEQNLEGNL